MDIAATINFQLIRERIKNIALKDFEFEISYEHQRMWMPTKQSLSKISVARQINIELFDNRDMWI